MNNETFHGIVRLFDIGRILGVVLCLVSVPVQAEPGINIAVRGGGNASTFNGDNSKYKYGLSAGVSGLLEWPLNAPFSLGAQMDVLYTPRGADLVFEGEYVGTFRHHYLDVALAIRPSIRTGSVSVYLLLGGSWNLLLRASRTDSLGQKDDVTDGFSRHDVALLVGAGIALALPPKRVGPFHLGTFFLEGRHDWGLRDVSPTTDSDLNNRTTSLMLGLSFALGSGAASPVTATSAR